MHPSTLSAADFDCDMYVLVLCPSQNPLLSRIWVHLPRLEGMGGELGLGPLQLYHLVAGGRACRPYGPVSDLTT